MATAVLFLFATHPAIAEESTTKEPCWEIYPGGKEVAPFSALLLNKCDGGSYLLTRVGPTDKQGKSNGSWIWRWSPLNIERNEAILSLPGGGQYLTQPVQ